MGKPNRALPMAKWRRAGCEDEEQVACAILAWNALAQTMAVILSHFLTHTPHPTPPLASTIISSPLFRPFSHAKIVTLVTAFKHAVNLRLMALQDEETTLFTRAYGLGWPNGSVAWSRAPKASKPSFDSSPLGLDDLKDKLSADTESGSVRAKTEDELIVALTEIMELYGAPKDSAWEKEFQSETEHGERELRCSHSSPFSTDRDQ